MSVNYTNTKSKLTLQNQVTSFQEAVNQLIDQHFSFRNSGISSELASAQTSTDAEYNNSIEMLQVSLISWEAGVGSPPIVNVIFASLLKLNLLSLP